MKQILVPALMSAVLLTACTRNVELQQRKPEQAGQPMDPLKIAARMAATRAAALAGDQQAVQANMQAMNDDFRKAIKLADPSRRVDREAARAAIRHIEGVRSVAWIDSSDLLVIVSSNHARSYTTIDAICIALEPLGDTLGVVVNLQSGAALSADDLAILSRNCQLAPGDRAMLQPARKVDVVAPDILAQHRANNPDSRQLELAEWKRKNAESMRILEENDRRNAQSMDH